MSDKQLRPARKNREGVQDQLRTVIRRARELAEGMDRETLNRRPAPDAWSVAECLDHVNETVRLYLPELTESIESARDAGHHAAPGSEERTLLGRLVVWTQEPPVRIRMKTFGPLEPAGDQEPAELLDTFETLHEELIVRINEAADLDRRRVRLRSVLDSRLKLSLGDWFHFLAAHARRHLWQAGRAKERVEKPVDGGSGGG